MHFSSEGVIPTTTAVPDIVDLSTDYLAMMTREDRIHTIKDFLMRPIIIHNGSWSSSDPAETQLFTANFPETLISNNMYQEKLRGFVGLRAKLVIQVQVNSQPFQQGRLMLQYFPYAQYMPNRVTLTNATLQGRSGCPRTDLDLSVGTEVQMDIPYVSPHGYYNLITGQGSFGSIYLVVYSQLRDQISGAGSVEYTVWAHLEDVDIQYPTGANIYTGNEPNFSSIGQQISQGKYTEKEFRKLWNSKAYQKPPAKIFAQVASELKQLKDNGTISSGLGQVSEGLNTMSKIPILGNMFTKPAWISAQASNIFKMLGFSKPTTQGLPCESKLRGQNRMANYDGADTSHKLALSACNEIETKPGLAGSSADEMDFSHILSIPNYWDRFTWSTDNLNDAVIWTNYVTPFKVKAYSDTITDRFRCTHMGYVANAFTYWRGSIVYTFKFVKTQYHSGRLRISFIPFYYNDTISTGVPDVSRTQKIVVDLRTSTEVAFTVPYPSTRPWMFSIRPESSWLGENNTLMYNAVSGIVRVEVLNQLVAANNVFQSIDTIVEVSGGPDLTFAGPTSPSYVPYSGEFTAEQTKIKKQEHDDEYSNEVTHHRKIHAQVMGENEAIPRNEAQHGVHPMAIDSHKIDSNWSPEAHCIGEKIMSVRQLIKRFGHFFNLNVNAANPAVIIAPFSVQEPISNTSSDKSISQFEYYYYLYAFWRGSMRIKSSTYTSSGAEEKSTAPSNSNNIWTVGLFTSVQDTFNTLVNRFSAGGVPVQLTTPLTAPMLNMGNSTIDVATNVEGLIEMEAPYYNVSHISPATLYTNTEKPVEISNVLKGHIPPAIITVSSRAKNSFPSENSGETNLSFYRAVGDDFSFMYLVGVPPLVNVNRAE